MQQPLLGPGKSEAVWSTKEGEALTGAGDKSPDFLTDHREELKQIMREHEKELASIRFEFRDTLGQTFVDVGWAMLGLVMAGFGFFRVDQLTSSLAADFAGISDNVDFVKANIDKIGTLAGIYGVEETFWWGIVGAGLGIAGLGVAWWAFRKSSRDSRRQNRINQATLVAVMNIVNLGITSIRSDFGPIRGLVQNQSDLGIITHSTQDKPQTKRKGRRGR
jgi:hypothetical protein